MSESKNQKRGGWFRRKKPQAQIQAKKTLHNYAFIDSQNLNLGVQKVGWKMDWRKFREWLRTEHDVEQAFMFIGYLPENENLYQQMYDHGFLVVLKPTLEISQVEKPGDKKEDKPATKGNIDADLVLHAMKELPNYKKAILVSGDGDFFGLIEYLASQEKLAKVLTPNRRYSTLLKDFDSHIEDINAYRRELAYRDRRVGPKRRAIATQRQDRK
ncbi:MAG: hypothetical protein QG629_354 [Patescibacteria group bacterium]|nr:NYN domain-containing protein [Candidatus Saccharibacteria bacterium]MDQ5963272.1 hypothetical protein [Patescibacteria group bacterium]